ncbi:hypothetical protein FQN54_005510 [Arachnomyces sp. PD_36]|nr:hypothetical protein FQN54_005510 [Arachnomyces sp. PD_36]
MAFNTPFSSSPPSTPDRRSLASNPSTTPAGPPPPSSAPSFTPLGPPPSSVFGSSQLGSGTKLRFGESTYSEGPIDEEDAESMFASSYASSSFPQSRTRNGTPAKPFGSRSGLGGLQSSTFGNSEFGGGRSGFLGRSGLNQELRFDEDDDAEGEMDIDPKLPSSQPSSALPKSSIYRNPQSAKRAKIDERWAHQRPSPKGLHPPRNKPSPIPSIARDIAAKSDAAPVQEKSSLILESEDVFCRLYDEARSLERNSEDFRPLLASVSEDLVRVWTSHAGSGPLPSGFHKPNGTVNLKEATSLGSLLLQLHHPPLAKTKTPSGAMRPSASRAMVLATQDDQRQVPIPKILLDWVNLYHAPRINSKSLQMAGLNPTASPQFWDAILSLTLRGHFSEVIQLLKAADFKYARSALEDGQAQAGYHGAQLQNIQKAVNRAVQTLSSSPIQSDDWDVKGFDWTMFRRKVATTVSELEDFAEGHDREPDAVEDRFHASNFGIPAGDNNASFSQSSRMAESRVPWTIYQNLKTMYYIILGDTSVVLSRSQDWIEATIALTVWWDGDDDNEVTRDSLNARRSITKPPQSQAPRSVDSNPEEAYLRRLDYTFASTTNLETNGAFEVNPMDNLEVGMASLFENNVEGVLDILQTWSLAITSAIVEVGSLGGWLETSAGARPLPGLNENDLMVLSYGQDEKRVHKDGILIKYATGLSERELLENSSGVREGWEIALEILSRLDDRDLMQKKVNNLLDTLPIKTSVRMDKVVLLCTELGFDTESRKISERYGDTVAESSENFGMALLCYARAHCSKKIKNVLDLLISCSLVQSMAYPPTDDLDDDLRSLIHDPKTCLSAIASTDAEAAGMLQFYFSGYATLRRFYEIRDEELHLEKGQKPKYRPLARRRAAAEGLVAVIRSASDSIYGGLYDQDRDSAVQVDGLLALLGEALVFIDKPNRLTIDQQYTILSAIEDLETVTRRVYTQCEECLQSTLIHYTHYNNNRNEISPNHSQQHQQSQQQRPSFPTSPRHLLKKSVSSLTASSGFSLIGSEMLESQNLRQQQQMMKSTTSGPSSIGGSGVLVPRQGNDNEDASRGWDWRSGFSGKEVSGGDIIRMLRLGLAEGLSFAALETGR